MRALAGRRALVTGASRGIRRGNALGLGAAGADVAVNYHVPPTPEFGRDNATDALSVVSELEAMGRRASAVEADVSNGAAVHGMLDQVVADLGGVDILVNSAGICPFHDFLTMPEDVWDRVHAVIIGASSISALVGGG